ncbi:MAG: hypothetical protein R3220_00745 [Balneolaceae bacterium]|nr:hypothetical protein [Balneolaceae bacterium]
MKRLISARNIFLIIFFALQVLGIVMGRFTSVKYFCWAPYDEISQYEITATVNGRELNEDQILHRYRKFKKGRENRSIHNLISIIRQYETTYGNNEDANVELSFVTNGHRKTIWKWPEDKFIPKN